MSDQQSIKHFFAKLELRGISISLDERGLIRVKGKKDQLDQALVAELKAKKSAIGLYLTQLGLQTSQADTALIKKMPAVKPTPIINAKRDQDADSFKASESTLTHQSTRLSTEEQHHLIHTLNQTHLDRFKSDAFANITIHGLFEAQVVEQPDKIALEYNGDSLTYAQLNQKANQLAFYLRHDSLAEEALIGICLGPSVQMIIAMLAVLKAGGTYVPFDPQADNVIASNDINIMICEGDSVDWVVDHSLHCINLADVDINQAISCCATANPPLLETQSAYSLACVFYNDENQGVMIEHGNIIRLMSDANFLTINSNDVVAQVSSPVIDRTIIEVWGALTNGAKLCGLDATKLNRTLVANKITILVINTALLSTIALTNPASLSHLRCLLFGSEALDQHTLDVIFNLGKVPQLINTYGPTENTVLSCYAQISQGIKEQLIGTPVTGTVCFILDDEQQLIKQGAVGYLYFGGLGLARGYLNGWQATESRFKPSLFGDDPNDRIFNVGVKARYLDDGAIVLIDRHTIEAQVKHRPSSAQSLSEPMGESRQSSSANGLFYQPIWHSQPFTNLVKYDLKQQSGCYIIFADSYGIADCVAQRLRSQQQKVILVDVGERFTCIKPEHYLINAALLTDYEQLIDDLALVECQVIHLWSLAATEAPGGYEPVFEQLTRFDNHQSKGLMSGRLLVSALTSSTTKLLSLTVVTHDTLSVTGDERLVPSALTVAALKQQYQKTFHIDLSLADSHPSMAQVQRYGQLLCDELLLLARQTQMAIRGKQRWVSTMSPCELTVNTPRVLQSGGVYVIVGDNGVICLTMAGHLIALDNTINVVIVGKLDEKQLSNIPPQVLICPADISSQQEVDIAFADIGQDLGAVCGVILCSVSPQVHGLFLIEAQVSRCSVDFCLLVNVVAQEQQYQAVQLFVQGFVQLQHYQGKEYWTNVVYPSVESIKDFSAFVQLLCGQTPALLAYRAKA